MHNLDEKYHYLEEVNLGILRNIPEGTMEILDVGCGYGALGEELVKKGHTVLGIDISRDAIEVAKKRITKALVADAVDIASLPKEIREKKYDIIIFSDIIEHIANPLKMLKDYKIFLKPEGKIIVSVPNIATLPMRLKLLIGNFDYTDTGTLDRTHLRFFTRKSAKKLIKKAGYEIEKVDITPNIIRPVFPLLRKKLVKENNPRAVIESPKYRLYKKRVLPLERKISKIWGNGLSFQFIFVARVDK